MRLIDREELRQMLDRGDDLKLGIILGEWAYRAKHIPGSLHLETIEKPGVALDTNDEIVVYCSSPSCVASVAACSMLAQNGYGNVRRYAVRLEDREGAGYPLEGGMAR